MSEIIIDARGLACPEPVILTKKALNSNKEFIVLVDNETAKENIVRFCGNSKALTSIEKDGTDWKISVSK